MSSFKICCKFFWRQNSAWLRFDVFHSET